jgi:putative transposase
MQREYLHTGIVPLLKYGAQEQIKSADKRETENKSARQVLCEQTAAAWQALKDQDISDVVIARTLKINRSTLYRRRKYLETVPPPRKTYTKRATKFNADTIRLVRQIRIENPTFGKDKIAPILSRDHNIKISKSSVGRILKTLKLPKSNAAIRTKRKRIFNKHAKTHEFKPYDEINIGEMVQIDHMTVTINGVTVKHFAAWDRGSRVIYANVYRDATSETAKKFLLEYLSKTKFPVKSIQVDGGSEFMGVFEETCEELMKDLFVLPPAMPKYNGGVERSNGMFRRELYENKSITDSSLIGIRRELFKHVEKYNSYRPHDALYDLTPYEYLNLPPSERPKPKTYRKRKLKSIKVLRNKS